MKKLTTVDAEEEERGRVNFHLSVQSEALETDQRKNEGKQNKTNQRKLSPRFH
jgi:hypothetical protein